MIHLAMWLASGLFLVWFFAIVSHLVWRLIVAMSDSVRTVTRAMFAPIMAAHRATWGWRGPLALGLKMTP